MQSDRTWPDRIWPVLLSGGAGTRLWPLSRQALPKQLIALAGPQTMLQATAARVADPLKFAPPIIVGNAVHADQILTQLAAIDIAPQLILEPCARNTGPALALAALEIARHDPAAKMLALPSDHLVRDVAAFDAAVTRAQAAAAQGWLVTLGINADSPETGYGYIEGGKPLFDGVHHVVRFVEKPDRATAESYVASGRFAWNGGYLMARVDAVIAALEALQPEMLAACRDALDQARRDGVSVFPDIANFARCTSTSFDNAVLEHAANVAVVPVAMGWSDIGSWDALRDVEPHDDAANALTGRIIAIDTQRCLIFSDGPVVATIGVQDINIVATHDAVLVTAAGRAQDVKAVVARLDGDASLLAPVSIGESWGRRRRLTGGGDVLVEEILLDRGACWPDAEGEITVIAGAVTVNGTRHGAGARIDVRHAAVTAHDTATLLRITGRIKSAARSAAAMV
jgi:mannose-1-phosphate guanylyltransferase